MEWRTKVELFEQIRREFEFGVGTISGVAKKLNIHRRMVREAIGSALPARRKKVERPRWKLAAAITFIDQILETDKNTTWEANWDEPRFASQRLARSPPNRPSFDWFAA